MIISTIFRLAGRSTTAELHFLSLRNNGKNHLSKTQYFVMKSFWFN